MSTGRERGCQQARGQRLAPSCEPQRRDGSLGDRAGRAPHMARRKVWRALQAGNVWIVDADVRQSLDTIEQDQRMHGRAEDISDGRGRPLLRDILRAGVCDGARWQPTLTGGPQGGGASPWWSHLFLTPLDRPMPLAGVGLTRWADDLVVLCRTRGEAPRALATAARLLQEERGGRRPPQKTRLVHGSQGFAVLGSKVQQGTGHPLPASKRRGRSHPLTL